MNIHQTLTPIFHFGMMHMNAVATLLRRALKMESPLAYAPARRRAANDGPATHQLQFAYQPVIAVKPAANATEKLLDGWLQSRFYSVSAARPMPNFRVSPAALSNADRFCLGHAASALINLQSIGMAGRTVVHLSPSCLMDPLLPVFIISLFQRRGVSLIGIDVTLGNGRPRRLEGRVTLDTVPEFPALVRHHED